MPETRKLLRRYDVHLEDKSKLTTAGLPQQVRGDIGVWFGLIRV